MKNSIKNKIDELVSLRKNYMDYKHSKNIHNELKQLYIENYTPKRSNEEYLDLFLNHDVSIEERHPQERNYSHAVYSAFSVASQHVYGITKKHCLDLIFEEVEKKKAN